MAKSAKSKKANRKKGAEHQSAVENECSAADHDHEHHRHDHGHGHGHCCCEDHCSPPLPRILNMNFIKFEGSAQRHPLRDCPGKFIVYEQYKSEEELPRIMELMSSDLSEPYSIFTFRYFINTWPDLCFSAILLDETDPEKPTRKVIGSIVCKLDYHKPETRHCIRGYIAMVAVEKEFRMYGVGSVLVCNAIDIMQKKNCDEVALETEVSNLAALKLYERLGFVRDKRLHRYYLNSGDAYRLKLWLSPLFP
eukprot:RCo037478